MRYINLRLTLAMTRGAAWPRGKLGVGCKKEQRHFNGSRRNIHLAAVIVYSPMGHCPLI